MSRRFTKGRWLSLTLISVFIISSLSLNFSSANMNEKTNQYYEDISYKLFKEDPTNPTQILKYKFLAEEKSENNDKPKLSIPVHQDVIDDVRDFWIINSFYDFPYNYVEKSARLLAIGGHSYVYVLTSLVSSQGLSNAQNNAILWKNEFLRKVLARPSISVWKIIRKIK